MQRKPGFPVVNCSIKMPEGVPSSESVQVEEDCEQRRQQLINFGHAQWGCNNWNWGVNKQELDFVDFANGKYTAGVVAFVTIAVKSSHIHRENIGYATSTSSTKGMAIYKSRKCAVTNALRETLLSFGGGVAADLMDLLDHKSECTYPAPPEPLPENNQNLTNVPPERKNSPLLNIRKDSVDSTSSTVNNVRPSLPLVPPTLKNTVVANPRPPVAKTHPMPADLPPAANRAPLPPPAGALRPNSNVSYVLHPMMGGLPVPPMYAPQPRPAPPHAPMQHIFPNYYDYAGAWHYPCETYDRHHGNVNLNFNIPPKNLVVNSRAGATECRNACGVRPGPEGEPLQYGPTPQGCWVKPTIFYDGFWTEHKVKKWVAEQVEKHIPDDSSQKPPSPSGGQPDSSSSN